MNLRAHLSKTQARLAGMTPEQKRKLQTATGISHTSLWRIETGKKIPSVWEYHDLLAAMPKGKA